MLIRSAVSRLSAETTRLSSSLRALEKDAAELRREVAASSTKRTLFYHFQSFSLRNNKYFSIQVRARDEAVADRERRIADMKRAAIELEKNRQVLNYLVDVPYHVVIFLEYVSNGDGSTTVRVQFVFV